MEIRNELIKQTYDEQEKNYIGFLKDLKNKEVLPILLNCARQEIKMNSNTKDLLEDDKKDVKTEVLVALDKQLSETDDIQITEDGRVVSLLSVDNNRSLSISFDIKKSVIERFKDLKNDMELTKDIIKVIERDEILSGNSEEEAKKMSKDENNIRSRITQIALQYSIGEKEVLVNGDKELIRNIFFNKSDIRKRDNLLEQGEKVK